MKQKYYSCPSVYEEESFDTIAEAVRHAIATYANDWTGKIKVAEFAPSRSNSVRWCDELEDVVYPSDGSCDGCREKEFIGRSHICKHLSWCFMPTGRKWEYSHDGGGYDEKKLRRIE